MQLDLRLTFTGCIARLKGSQRRDVCSSASDKRFMASATPASNNADDGSCTW